VVEPRQGWSAGHVCAVVGETLDEEVELELRRVLEASGVDPVDLRPDTPLTALHLDSLDRLELLQAIDDRFGVAIDPASLLRAVTVGEATEIIQQEVARA
jgi:acyl carrier protein